MCDQIRSAICGVITCFMSCTARIIVLPGNAGYSTWHSMTERLSFSSFGFKRLLPQPRFALDQVRLSALPELWSNTVSCYRNMGCLMSSLLRSPWLLAP